MLEVVLAACYNLFTVSETTATTIFIDLTTKDDPLCPLEFRIAISATLECPAPQIIQFQKAIFTEYKNFSLVFTCRDTLASQQQLCEGLLQDGKIDFRNSKVRLREIDGREDLIDCECTRKTQQTAIIVIAIVCFVALVGAATYTIYKCKMRSEIAVPAQQSSQIMNCVEYSNDSMSSVSFLRTAEPVGNGSF